MALGMVFPGQGSQAVGMLVDLMEAEPVVRDTFSVASDALGYDLAALVAEGPKERLDDTRCTQPAMLTAGVAVWRAWQSRGGATPAVMAGHSLGEYTALVCAGALDFAATVSLVEFRGEAMQKAVPAGQGAMAAVLGLDDEAVEAVCAEAADGEVVEAVNFNAPGQVVIAGSVDAVERAVKLASERGAKRAITLPVSVPSHCALMRPAAEAMGERLAGTDVRLPEVPVVHNVDAEPRDSAAGIREALTEQLYRPVRWVDCVRAMQRLDVSSLVEAGPGKVLAGLNRRIERRMPAAPAFDPDSLGAALGAA